MMLTWRCEITFSERDFTRVFCGCSVSLCSFCITRSFYSASFCSFCSRSSFTPSLPSPLSTSSLSPIDFLFPSRLSYPLLSSRDLHFGAQRAQHSGQPRWSFSRATCWPAVQSNSCIWNRSEHTPSSCL